MKSYAGAVSLKRRARRCKYLDCCVTKIDVRLGSEREMPFGYSGDDDLRPSLDEVQKYRNDFDEALVRIIIAVDSIRLKMVSDICCDRPAPSL